MSYNETLTDEDFDHYWVINDKLITLLDGNHDTILTLDKQDWKQLSDWVNCNLVSKREREK